MRHVYKIIFATSLLAGVGLPARADVGLLLNAKPNIHPELVKAEIIGEGHSAVYLSRVCPETPIKLRLCAPGEQGSVLQNYQDYKEDQPYEWNIVPLSEYLYGVDDLRDRPLFATPELLTALQNHYRATYLRDLCTTPRCIKDADANWRDAVAAAFVREIYIFSVHTTVEQDEQFIREFNARPNVNHYHAVSRNCADFAKMVVNLYFPHSAHRDFLNDFGMTGPKAIARSFTHYAEHHPELQLRVIRVEQVPGTYRRSSDCREGTEQTVRSTKWLVPITVLEVHAVPVLAASYVLTGRFNPDHELRNHPSEDVAVLYQQMAEAKEDGDMAEQKQLKRDMRADREQEIGTDEQWQQYRSRFEEILRTAIDDGIVADHHKLETTFRTMQANGRTYLDDRGEPWLEMDSDGEVRRVGLSANNVFSADSNREMALQVMLARTNALLSAQSNHRELWPEFESDWAMLQQAEEQMPAHGTRASIVTRAPQQ
jgi:hypothetical protein